MIQPPPTPQPPDQPTQRVPITRVDVMSLLLSILTVALAWIMSNRDMSFAYPGIYPHSSANEFSPYVIIGIFTVLYAVLTLMAYRMSYGLYAGFHHIAVVAVYLTFGPIAAVATAFVGRIVSEIGRALLYKRLELRPHTVREAAIGLLFHAGAHGLSTLIGGLVYGLLGGTMPLTNIEPVLLGAVIGMFAVNVIVYQALLLTRVYWSGKLIDSDKLGDTLAPLLFGQVFALPLSLLLPITYYNLPPFAFLMLVTGIVMAGVLFRISERSRWALERRIVELATLNHLGQSLTSTLNRADLMQSTYEQVAQLMEVDTFYIALYTPETRTLSFPFVMQNGRLTQWDARQGGNGLSEYIIRTRKALLLSGSLKDEAAALGITLVEQDAACFLGVLLTAGDETVGVLAVQSLMRTNAYGRSEMALLSTIGAQTAITLRNTSLYSRVWEMADELALLNNVSSVVTATLDLNIVLDTTCAVVLQIGHADKTGIFLAAEDGKTLRLVHSIGLSDDYVAQFQNIMTDDESWPSQALKLREAMAISDVRTDPRGLGLRSLAEIENYTALLIVPLIASEQVIGFLAAFYEAPHLFGKSELDLMNTLANQVAVTVANARLYQDTQSRAQAMTRLVEASRAFTASLDLRSIAQKVLDELEDILLPDVTALMLLNANATLRPIAVRGIESIEISSEGSIGQAITTRTALMLPNSSADLALLKELALKSLFVIPLVGADSVIGIVLVGHKTLRTLAQGERQLAEALVNQAATAIRNAQLYSQTDEALGDRLSELSAIEAISRKISGALDLETIINDVLDTAISMTHASLAGFGLVEDHDTQLLRYVERYPRDSNMPHVSRIIEREKGVIGHVMQTGEIAHVPDVSLVPEYYSESLPGMASILVVPIGHNSEQVGLIQLASDRLDAFTDAHERFLVNLAEHAAIAVGNARLFEERQTQIEMLIKFRNLSLELLSLNTLYDVMNLIVEYALIIAHAKDAHLYLYDKATDTLTFGASLWLDGRENIEAARPQRGGSTWTVASTGQPQFIEDVAKQDLPQQFNSGPGFRAIARIPLKRGASVLGVLNVAYHEPHYFTDSETRALDLLANQAAIAIENARLFDEQRISRNRMQTILQSIRDGIMLLGQDGDIVVANPAAERLMNFPLRVYGNENLLRLIAKSKRDERWKSIAEPLISIVHQSLEDIKQNKDNISKQTFQIEVQGIARDIESRILPVHDAAGNLTGRLIVLRDISEEKATERFREELTNMIVHDLRSPLSGIISSLRLIEDMIATNDLTGFEQVLGIAISSSENQMRMIESMLEIDKLEKGQMPLQAERTKIVPVVRKAITALDLVASNAQIRLIDCVPADFPNVEIDEELIRRVLVNLLDNAIRHTPAEGEIRVEAHVANGSGLAKIGVLDSGKGIPPEFRERIFKRFVQVPKSALRGQRGVGLGLTFCKLAIEAHGGKIWVDSSPSGGAAFWFTLPIAEP